MATIRITLLSLLLFVVADGHAADDLEAFPAAEPGQARFVLRLPPQPDETALKVELQVGRTVEVDARNRHFFVGGIDAVSIPGWGYTRYVVAQLGPMAGTLMAVDPSEPRVRRFVTLGGEPFLVRYNSRLPLVVYVPEGGEVRYRLWRADGDAAAVDPG